MFSNISIMSSGKRPPEPWDSFLKDLDSAMSAPVRLGCIGGFVVTQLYGLDRNTADMDVIELAPREAADTVLTFASRGGPLSRKHLVYIRNHSAGWRGTAMKSRLPESLRRERDMIDRVNQGIGRCDKLGRGEAFIASDRLRPEQKGAVGFVLGSRDRVVAISGAAGTGKTATPQELRRGLAEAGREVVAIAPTMSAVEELQKVGFGYAMTVARLLQDPAGQQQVRRKVLILDEARMVSGRQMAEFLRLAELTDARVVFTDRGAAPDAERLPRRDSGAAACAGARFREAGCDGLGPRSNDSRTCAGSRSGVWRGAV